MTFIVTINNIGKKVSNISKRIKYRGVQNLIGKGRVFINLTRNFKRVYSNSPAITHQLERVTNSTPFRALEKGVDHAEKIDGIIRSPQGLHLNNVLRLVMVMKLNRQYE